MNYEAVYRTAPATPGLLNMLFLVFLLPKNWKVSKANTGEFAVKLSEHVAEDSEESHPMFKCT